MIEYLFLSLLLGHYQAKLRSSVHVTPSGCWEWTRSTDGRYGQFWMAGARFKAHVAAALLFRGVRLRKRVLCHQCDNKLCCCPDHLIPGSQKRNRWETSERNVAVPGLSFAQVARIRNLLTRGHKRAEVARRIGCHYTTVMRIQRGDIR